MKKETKKNNVLKLSIDKWQAIGNDAGEDRGVENCSLCDQYYKEGCISCPVFLKTECRPVRLLGAWLGLLAMITLAFVN